MRHVRPTSGFFHGNRWHTPEEIVEIEDDRRAAQVVAEGSGIYVTPAPSFEPEPSPVIKTAADPKAKSRKSVIK